MGLMIIFPAAEEADTEVRLLQLLEPVFTEYPSCTVIRTEQELEPLLVEGKLAGKKLLFAAALGKDGMQTRLFSMLRMIRKRDADHTRTKEWQSGCLKGTTGAVLIDANTEQYTKSVGREIVRTANAAGCRFVGRPLVEGTGSLKNYLVQAKNRNCSLDEAYRYAALDLTERLMKPEPCRGKNQILCVHSCDSSTSNTFWLWNQVKEKLPSTIEVQEISLRDEPIMDCAGCSYETCMYFSRNMACFYGGEMVDEVYPALDQCKALVLLCPNYNDALGANLTAFINRLTAPFRRKPFKDKQLFALIVSGYSGSDIIECQLIDALNMNKSFQLPGNFALTETANMAGSIAKIPNIQEKIESYAEYLTRCILT